MIPRIQIDGLQFSDGSNIPVAAGLTLLIVGPNNVGKSQAIRDIVVMLGGDSGPRQVVRALAWHREGSLERFAEREDPEAPTGWNAELMASHGLASLSTASLLWNAGSLSAILPAFVYHATTEARLSGSTPQDLGDLFTQRRAISSLQKLYLDAGAEDRLSGLSQSAFNVGLVLDPWTGGTKVLLRMGSIDRPATPRPDADFIRRLRSLPPLHTQGDGIRSFIGMALEISTGHHDLIMVDEPEVFLHPPQARQIGKLIPQLAGERGAQAILSTHSADVIRGALESGKPVAVVRLTRDGDVNSASLVDSSSIAQLWSDPLLKSSNALDALFAHAAVLCESDSDCRYFSSVMDGFEPNDLRAGLDLHFVGCNGKDRLPVVASALHAARVPIRMILDFDALDAWARIEALCRAIGVDPEPMRRNWNIMNSSLAAGPQSWTRAETEAVVARAIDRISADKFGQRQLNAIRDRLKIASRWSTAKAQGLSAFKGEPFEAASRLVSQLKSVGIFVVPVGEVESIVRSVGGHGSGWVASVIERGLHLTEASSVAAELMREVQDSIG